MLMAQNETKCNESRERMKKVTTTLAIKDKRVHKAKLLCWRNKNFSRLNVWEWIIIIGIWSRTSIGVCVPLSLSLYCTREYRRAEKWLMEFSLCNIFHSILNFSLFSRSVDFSLSALNLIYALLPISGKIKALRHRNWFLSMFENFIVARIPMF